MWAPDVPMMRKEKKRQDQSTVSGIGLPDGDYSVTVPNKPLLSGGLGPHLNALLRSTGPQEAKASLLQRCGQDPVT
jgi:hypothetical protein